MPRALPRVGARWQRARHLGHRDPHLHLGDLRRGVRRARGLYGISNFMSTMSAASLKVSVSVPPNSRTLRAMLPCFCCLHAARARGLLPSAFCRKNDNHSRTTRPAVLRARRRYRSVQYASTSRRRRIRSESGGARAPWRDRTTIWSMWWCIGPCEDACGRFNGRVCTCSGDPQTLVPLSPTHGLGACTWRQCKKLKVTSAFDICRPGDAVVSCDRPA